jgi:hypothetical protein
MQRQIQKMLRVQDAGFEKGLSELMRVKGGMDGSLLAQDYSLYSTYEIHLEGPVAVAATGATTPNLTLGGKSLQVLHDPKLQSQWLAFGIDIGTSGPTAVFFWRRQEPAPEQYMEEVKALGDRQLAEFLMQFFFVHCENTYFAPSWWEALDGPKQEFLAELMANFNPYYFPPKYQLDRAVAPWLVVSRRSN